VNFASGLGGIADVRLRQDSGNSGRDPARGVTSMFEKLIKLQKRLIRGGG